VISDTLHRVGDLGSGCVMNDAEPVQADFWWCRICGAHVQPWALAVITATIFKPYHNAATTTPARPLRGSLSDTILPVRHSAGLAGSDTAVLSDPDCGAGTFSQL
jgi:hypothetical protein